jgi:hypothetical protein
MSKLLADNVWFKIGDAFYKLSDQFTQFIGFGTAADKFLYTTDVKTWAEGSITSAGRNLIDDADAAAQRATLGLGSSALLSIGATQTGWASWVFKAPDNETIRLVIKSPKAYTVTEATTRTNSGTATVTLSINGTPLGGTANSASTTEQSQAHSSANSVAVGDDLEVTFASVSSADNLTLTLAVTYVLT